MSSLPKSVKSLAAGGGLMVFALVAGCGSSKSARASDEVASSAPADAVSNAPEAPIANAAVADVAALPAEPASFAGDTLCEAGEISLFSCEIGAKRVSVCSSGSGAVYRYGTPAQVELTSRSVTFANRGYSGGGESQLTAKNGDYTYTAFDSTIRTSFGEGGNDPEFSSGLVIARGGRVISSKMCKGESTVDASAGGALPAGSFVEH